MTVIEMPCPSLPLGRHRSFSFEMEATRLLMRCQRLFIERRNTVENIPTKDTIILNNSEFNTIISLLIVLYCISVYY